MDPLNFTGAYGGKKKKDFTESNKRSKERNKNLSEREQKQIAESRKRTQERYRKSKAKQ